MHTTVGNTQHRSFDTGTRGSCKTSHVQYDFLPGAPSKRIMVLLSQALFGCARLAPMYNVGCSHISYVIQESLHFVMSRLPAVYIAFARTKHEKHGASVQRLNAAVILQSKFVRTAGLLAIKATCTMVETVSGSLSGRVQEVERSSARWNSH